MSIGLLLILYVILAPFAASFFWWAWGGLPRDDSDRVFGIMFSLMLWPINALMAVVLLAVPTMTKLEERGKR